MKGLVFHVRHLKDKKRHIVKGLNKEGADTFTFPELDRQTGQAPTTTVTAYFQRRYNITLQHGYLPLIETSKGLFPAELCFCSGERFKGDSESLAADIIKFAAQKPGDRYKSIMDNVRRLDIGNQQVPASMGLSVATRMLSVNARILPPPRICYSGGVINEPGIDQGAWNLRAKRFVEGKSFLSWGAFIYTRTRDLNSGPYRQFLQELSTELAVYGINASREPAAILLANPVGNIPDEVQNLWAKVGNTFNRKPDLIIVFLAQGASPQLYRVIKQICEIKVGWVILKVMCTANILN